MTNTIENTLEQKARFFAQHIGCKVRVFREGVVDHIGVICGMQENVDKDYFIQYRPNGNGFLSLAHIEYCTLLPKSLADISDEDGRILIAIICPTMCEITPVTRKGLTKIQIVKFGHDNNNIVLGLYGAIWNTSHSKTFIQYNLHANDYLRSKGYLLSWNGLYEKQLISRGWVVLKESEVANG